MTSMRRRYVALTSLRRHVPAGNVSPLGPLNILNLAPPPQYSKPSYAYGSTDTYVQLKSVKKTFCSQSWSKDTCTDKELEIFYILMADHSTGWPLMERRTFVGVEGTIYWQESLMMSSCCYICGYQTLACRDFDKAIDGPMHNCGFVLVSS